MTFEDLIEKFKEHIKVSDKDSFVMTNGFYFHKDGEITFNIHSFGKENTPHTVWILVAQNRNPDLMNKFIESIL